VLAMVVFWELKHVLGMLSVVTYWVIFKNEI
jgi:ribosomal protein L30/L7E